MRINWRDCDKPRDVLSAHVAGDLGFDPLQLRFSYPGGLPEARARELAYGRVGAPRRCTRPGITAAHHVSRTHAPHCRAAMLAVVVFVLQELVTAAPVLEITRAWLPFLQ